MIRATVLALEQSVSSGVMMIYDLLKMAGTRTTEDVGGRWIPLFDVCIASGDGRPIRYSECLEIKPHAAVADIDRTDLVVVPSGGYRPAGLRGYPPELARWLKRMSADGADISGICTGVFLLAESGLLAGKKATTHWAYTDLFRSWHPDVRLFPEKIMTHDTGVSCSGGGSAGIDLMLYQIEKYGGGEAARYCSRMMLLDRGRTGQNPYAEGRFKMNHSDREILKAQRFIEENIGGAVMLEAVARHAGMSLRNFKRRFKAATGETPLVYIQKLRMETARKVLERDDVRIEVLAGMVGYEDMGFFRKLFSRYTGLSPSDYRQKFKSGMGVESVTKPGDGREFFAGRGQ